MLTTSLNSTSFTPKIQLAHQLAKMFHNGLTNCFKNKNKIKYNFYIRKLSLLTM